MKFDSFTMKPVGRISPILVLLFFLSSFSTTWAQLNPPPTTPGLVYILYKDSLGTLNPTTGAISKIGRLRDHISDVTTNGLGSIAVNSAGELFGLGNVFQPASPPDLVRIDPTTGKTELIGSYTPAVGTDGVKGIAFDGNDVLYGAEWAFNGRDIYTIDPTNATGVLLYDDVLPSEWYGGMEYNPTDGLLYLSDWNVTEIHTVDPVTGDYNKVFTGSVNPGHLAGDLFFDGIGDLYVTTGNAGAGPSLWKVDLANNTSTKVADLAEGVKAAVLATNTITSNAVPALSEWALFLFLLTMLCLGIVAVMNFQRSAALATSKGSMAMNSKLTFPFNKKGYLQAVKITLALVPAGFILIYLVWGKIIVDDFIGMSFAVPMVAYLIYLLRIKE
ncbi:MAG: hypothetical protein AAFZ15_25365 [Bacteroidota bacterium]